MTTPLETTCIDCLRREILDRLDKIQKDGEKLCKFPDVDQTYWQRAVNRAVMIMRHNIITLLREIRQGTLKV